MMSLDGARLRAALAAKVSGSWNLHRATAGMPLDHFVLYSSIAALGTPGQAPHAAANAFLDALAHRRRADGLPALSLGLGGVAEIGAAARLEAGGGRAAPGVEPMPPDRTLEAAGLLLASAEPHALLASVSWPKFTGGLPPGALRTYSGLLEAPPATAAEAAPDQRHLPTWLRSLAKRARVQALEDLLRERIAALLGLAPSQAPHRDQPLMQAGLDSLMTVQLRNGLQASLEISLSVTLVFDNPTIAHLAEHLAGQLETGGAPAAVAAVPGVADSPGGLEEALAELESLSEDEVKQRLREGR
jgi:aryl carrier-like protein